MPDVLVLLTTFGGRALFGAAGIVFGPIVGALFLTIWTLWESAIEDASLGDDSAQPAPATAWDRGRKNWYYSGSGLEEVFMRAVRLFCTVILAFAFLCGCRTPQGSTPPEKRHSTLRMRDEALAELYTQRPAAKAHVERAPGYGVFSNVGSKIFLLATGNGFGVVVDNASGKNTYMRMVEVGGGVGLGYKKHKAVYVFNSKPALETFVRGGWQAGGDADAAFKVGDEGAGLSAALTTDELTKPITVYQFTEAGVALSATATGTRFYPDEELNYP
jgi:lipid-binding SYLF domain-containing protein